MVETFKAPYLRSSTAHPQKKKLVEDGSWFPCSATINKFYISIKFHCHLQGLLQGKSLSLLSYHPITALHSLPHSSSAVMQQTWSVDVGGGIIICNVQEGSSISFFFLYRSGECEKFSSVDQTAVKLKPCWPSKRILFCWPVKWFTICF